MIRRLFKRETRGSYTDCVVAGLTATASGTGNALTTGAVESCAGLWGRTLAAARIEGTDALTPRLRHQIGRDLIRSGQSVFAIDTLNGRLRFLPTAMHHVGPGWRYTLYFARPNGTTTKLNVARNGVLHLQWSVSPVHPWEGVSPLAAAPALAKLAALVETKLGEDLSTPTAHFLPTPLDGGAPALDSLRADIAGAQGKAVLAQGTASGWEEGRAQAGTNRDWESTRLGPEIPEQLRALFPDVLGAVAAVCGIPPSLVQFGKTDGTALREDFRRFVMASVEPVAASIAQTVGEAIDADVSFNFRGLWAHDLQGRASAFQKLVAGGLSVVEARAVVGL